MRPAGIFEIIQLSNSRRNFPKAQGSGDYNDKLDNKRDSVPYNFCKNIQN